MGKGTVPGRLCALRQCRAIAVAALQALNRTRIVGGVIRYDRGGRRWPVRVLLLLLVLFASGLGVLANRIAHLESWRVFWGGLLLAGLAAGGVGWVSLLESPVAHSGRGGSFAPASFGRLDAFPVLLSTSLLYTAVQACVFILCWLVVLICLAPQKLPGQILPLIALGLASAAAILLFGKALTRIPRAVLPAHLVRRALQTIPLTALVGQLALCAVVFSFLSPTAIGFARQPNPELEQQPTATVFASLMRPLASYLSDAAGSSLAGLWGGVTLLAGLSFLVIWVVERRGYDRELGAPPGAQRRLRSPMTPRRVESALLRREGNRIWLMFAILLGVSSWLSAHYLSGDRPVPYVRKLALWTPFWAAYTGWLVGIGIAAAQVTRDRAVRPLLSSLPITPGEMLGYKTAAVRLPMLLLATALLLPPLVALHFEGELLWKDATAFVALSLTAEAVVPIAFLSAGSLSPALSLPNLLIAIPLFGALLSSKPLTALPSLGALALVAFEARRAASIQLRWLDDADDELERETSVWRALLAYGAFAGLEALVTGALTPLSLTGATVAGYLVAATALLVLTSRGRQGLPPLQPIGIRPWLLGVGAAAGAGAALLARVYLRLVEGFGHDPDPIGEAFHGASPEGRYWLVVTLVVAAPIAEEIFFRGWLQPAIKIELPERWKRAAFVLTAFVFASVHPGISFPMIFLGGLITGALYEWTGGVAAGVCAHVAYNGLLLVLQG